MRKKLGLGFLLSLGIVATTTIGFSSWVIPSLNFTATPVVDDARAVAYIGGHEDTKYATIEAAVAATSQYNVSGQTVYVIPEISSIEDPIVINHDLTIPSGVTLCLPYSGEQATDVRNGTGSYFADKDKASVKNNLKTCVKLEGELYIEEGASVIVGGQIGSGSANRPQGMTTGSYAQISMAEDSSILCDGSILCYGYIKPEKPSADETAEIVVGNKTGKRSELTLPLVFYDYGGGSSAVSMYTNHELLGFLGGSADPYYFPMKIFDFPNIAVPMTIFGGSKMTALFGFNFSTLNSLGVEPQLMGSVPMIGQGSEAFLNLAIGSSVVIDYDPAYGNNFSSQDPIDLSGYTTDDFGAFQASTSTSGSLANRTSIEIFGNATISDIVATIPFSAEGSILENLVSGPITIETSGIFIPFSYKLDISVYSGILSVPVKTKWYPGSKLTISKDCGVSFLDETVFFAKDTFPNGLEGRPRYPEPSVDGFGDAEIENHGTVSIQAPFGGNILNGDPGDSEKVKFEGNSSRSVSTFECTGKPSCGINLGIIVVGDDNVCDTTAVSVNATANIYSSGTSADYASRVPFSSYQESSFNGDGTAYRPVEESTLTIYEGDFIDNTGRTLSYDIYENGVLLKHVIESNSGVTSITKGKSNETSQISIENLTNVAFVKNGDTYIAPDQNGRISFEWNHTSSQSVTIVPRSRIESITITTTDTRIKCSPSFSLTNISKGTSQTFQQDDNQSNIVHELLDSFNLEVGDTISLKNSKPSKCDQIKIGDTVLYQRGGWFSQDEYNDYVVLGQLTINVESNSLV